jgi:guanylate kinase
MAHGHYQGKAVHDSEIRNLFNRDYLLNSDWYAQRLQQKQQRDISLWQRNVSNLESFTKRNSHIDDPEYVQIKARLQLAIDKLKQVQGSDYIDFLKGTIGADAL